MSSGFPTGFDAAPVLEGQTVRLRPLVEADRAALFAVASDPLIWDQHPAHDRWKPEVFDAFLDEALAEGGGLVIEDAATGRVLGSSRYSTASARPGEIEIGWTFLERAVWGGAANREVKRLMVDHALTAFEAALFFVGAENHRSRRALEKIGAAQTDRTIMATRAGRPVEHLVYRLAAPVSPSGPVATS